MTWGRGGGYEDIYGQCIPGSRNRQCKGPGAGVYLTLAEDNSEALWPFVPV